MTQQLTTETLNALMPFGGHLGLRLVQADPDRVVAAMAWDERLTTAGGALHGGAVMGLADSVGGTLAFLNLPEGAATSTISSSTVFLRGVREGELTATGRLVHKGRSTIVVETELSQDGRTVAKTTQSQAVLLPGS
ncbi:MAG TPA: PaaI family thioesterase [Marmoricola sp.]|nr:PaaI family thioesterase [Marmoricola sp.]